MNFARRLFCSFVPAVLFFGMGGCALLKKGKTDQEEPAAATSPEPRVERATVPEQVGKVVLLNEEGRFVLVDLDFGFVPEQGTALKVMRHGSEIAILSVGDVRRRPFIVADVVKGEPQKGDIVYK